MKLKAELNISVAPRFKFPTLALNGYKFHLVMPET
jgi:hypothetical protein